MPHLSLSLNLNPNSDLPCSLIFAISLWHYPDKCRQEMADDLIQSSMAGAQPVPANFNANDADNLEDVSTPPQPGVATWGSYTEVSRNCLTDPQPPDRKAICCQGYEMHLPGNRPSSTTLTQTESDIPLHSRPTSGDILGHPRKGQGQHPPPDKD